MNRRLLTIFLTAAILIVLNQCKEMELQEIAAKRSLEWDFPLKRTHTGMLIGNGVQGLMVWGYENQINITIGRAGFWDHRGGNDFASRTTYREVKQLLYADDEEGLRKAFAIPEKNENDPPRPQQIGGGRLEISLPEDYSIQKGTLVLDNGTALIEVANNTGISKIIRIRQSMLSETSWVNLPAGMIDSVDLKLIPSWDFVKKDLEPYGVEPPERWEDKVSEGFQQNLPEDLPLAIAYKKSGQFITISSTLNENARTEVIEANNAFSVDDLRNETNEWWDQFWNDVPELELPDPVLQEIVDYGQYKLACATPPQGIACSLQGPFNEEYQLPPWSNDYHFNINIEMIYWPVLASNRLDHLNPVWDLLQSWWPQLSANGEKFFGRKGAVMLPHAVDDRCNVVGTFWTGTIDHACTAWMAQLAWMHYRYGMNETILEEMAWPLLVGAFEGYWAMLEEMSTPDGKTLLSLPVSVSPEFKGSRMDAWGRDASFQLAALHMVATNLQKAADILGKEKDPRWQQVRDKLPPYTTIKNPRTLEWPENVVERIALWEGMDLFESHRHHSHLAGIWPFMSYDPMSETHAAIVGNSLENWVLKGPGLWSGWCVPWASIINSRTGKIRASIEWLHWWEKNFTNEGRGTLHNAAFRGTSLISSPDFSRYVPGRDHNEIMQLDAGFGALTAVYEMLVQERDGVVYILPEVPFQWKDLSFSKILAPGGFLVSAAIKDGRRNEVSVISQYGGTIRLAHGLGETVLINEEPIRGEILEIETEPGEKYMLTPDN